MIMEYFERLIWGGGAHTRRGPGRIIKTWGCELFVGHPLPLRLVVWVFVVISAFEKGRGARYNYFYRTTRPPPPPPPLVMQCL